MPSDVGPPMATPRARGSTRQLARGEPAADGYPACAGIDRYSLEEPGPDNGLPRVRGDRPFMLASTGQLAEATPRARVFSGPYSGTPDTDPR